MALQNLGFGSFRFVTGYHRVREEEFLDGNVFRASDASGSTYGEGRGKNRAQLRLHPGPPCGGFALASALPDNVVEYSAGLVKGRGYVEVSSEALVDLGRFVVCDGH